MFDELKQLIKGDVASDTATTRLYSHDASLFELEPQAVIFPRDTADVCALVKYVSEHKQSNPLLSLTGRSGGTDMSGGSINDSLIVSFERYFKRTHHIADEKVWVQPGVYYHDFEPLTLKMGLLMPSYPASRDICMLGGMLANNAGGEKSLVYGKTAHYVNAVKVVLADGKEHMLTALSGSALESKLNEDNFEGQLTRQIYDLLKDKQELIAQNKPHVSKNSTGYNVWDAWDGQTLDLSKLIIGSQGTLGLITEAQLNLVPAKSLSGMLVAFLPTMDNLGQVINDVLPLKPTAFESFDRHTLLFAFRFFMSFRKTLGWKRFAFLGLSFIPVLRHLLRYLPHLPQIVLLVEFEGDHQAEIETKISALEAKLTEMGVESQRARDKSHEEKFWTMRRESFNLLRKNVKHKHTAPFIDDLIVPPEHLPAFLPRLTEILDRYKLLYTVAGHMGDGNFHIIPLMDLTVKTEREKIPDVLNEVTDLVLEYGGSLSGEHNDGLIRGPFLPRMYKPEMIEIFKSIKRIFDPQDIFNPHKKIDATWEYSSQHIRRSF